MKVIKGQSLVEAKGKAVNDSEVKNIANKIEAETVAQVDANLDGKPTEEERGEIWKILMRSLRTAEEKTLEAEMTGERASDFPNVLLIGGAGIGKTSQIKEWAKANDVKLFTLQGSSLDAADMGGLPMVTTVEVDPATGEQKTVKKLRAQKVGTGILDKLDRPNSVLFLDELNRAQPDVRAALLQLICDHITQDFDAEDGMRYYPNFLFTVAAINPSGKAGYQTFELDQAEKGRFGNYEIKAENAVQLKFMTDKYSKQAEVFKKANKPEWEQRALGRLALSKALLSADGFVFDDDDDLDKYAGDKDWNKLATTPRNLTILMDKCDGTKADLLDLWNHHCNNFHKSNVKRILNNYKDIENKANDALKQGTESSLLNRKQRNGMAAIRNMMGDDTGDEE